MFPEQESDGFSASFLKFRVGGAAEELDDSMEFAKPLGTRGHGVSEIFAVKKEVRAEFRVLFDLVIGRVEHAVAQGSSGGFFEGPVPADPVSLYRGALDDSRGWRQRRRRHEHGFALPE